MFLFFIVWCCTGLSYCDLDSGRLCYCFLTSALRGLNKLLIADFCFSIHLLKLIILVFSSILSFSASLSIHISASHFIR